MATTKINVTAVINAGTTINNAKKTVGNVKSSYNSTRKNIDGAILNRNNLRNNFSNISTRIANLETYISNIKSTVENGANKYYNTDVRIIREFNSKNNGLKTSSGKTSTAMFGNAAAFITDVKKIDKKKSSDSQNSTSTSAKKKKDGKKECILPWWLSNNRGINEGVFSILGPVGGLGTIGAIGGLGSNTGEFTTIRESNNIKGSAGSFSSDAVDNSFIDKSSSSTRGSSVAFAKNEKDENKASLLSGSVTKKGEFLGVKTSGTAEGDLIGGSVDTKAGAKWDIKEKEAGVEYGIEAEGHLANGSLKGNFGVLGGEVEGTVGVVGASGSIGATLYKDGKLSPSIEAGLKAKAAVAEGSAEVSIGTEEFNGHVNANGTLLGAEAEASGGIGMISYKDDNGKEKTELGISGKVSAEAYLAEGEVSGGFTLFGIDIDVGVSGKAGGAGVSAEGRVTAGGVSGEIGAGLGLGLGLELSIDWSDFSLF